MARLIYDANGQWVEGRASPELLREDLRKLPGEHVTKEIEDGDKIHAEDAPHVVGSILEDKAKEERNEGKALTVPEAIKSLPKLPPPGVVAPVAGQWWIDIVRTKVLSACLKRFADEYERGIDSDLSVKHLWWPKNNINAYQLRAGNPPSNRDRPKWLRNKRIEIDILNIPARIRDVMADLGCPMPNFRELIEQQSQDVQRMELMRGIQEALH